jgi:hypothetical protein
VNVVLSHPLADGVASVPMTKFGRFREIKSSTWSGSFAANLNVILDGADVTGFAIINVVCLNDAVGYITAVETGIGVAGILVASASVTDTLRVFIFALWPPALVVTPVAIVTVHCVPAERAAVAAVNVREAAAVPEFAAEAVNVVLPHPLADGVARAPKTKVGSLIAIVSDMARTELSENP